MQLFTLTCITLVLLSYSVTGKNVKFTFYWIIAEEGLYIQQIFLNKSSIVFIVDFSAGTDYTLKSCHGGTLAKISTDFWNSLHKECSGRLRTGESVYKFQCLSNVNHLFLSLSLFLDILMEVIVLVIVLQKFLVH